MGRRSDLPPSGLGYQTEPESFSKICQKSAKNGSLDFFFIRHQFRYVRPSVPHTGPFGFFFPSLQDEQTHLGVPFLTTQLLPGSHSTFWQDSAMGQLKESQSGQWCDVPLHSRHRTPPPNMRQKKSVLGSSSSADQAVAMEVLLEQQSSLEILSARPRCPQQHKCQSAGHRWCKQSAPNVVSGLRLAPPLETAADNGDRPVCTIRGNKCPMDWGS
ncbi:hypothetical protein HUJ04_012919 [Dendroctonus ponderosae]|nr:hypothetical protein HUJ04_012919 [Dendroctonus ponderosae]